MKKTLNYFILLTVLLFSHQISAQENTDFKAAEGSWLGKIPAGAISLRVIFNLSLAAEDSLAATLDSPDQGAKNIKIGPVILTGKNINIKAPLLMGEYKGTIVNDTLITGTWSQAGKSTPLDLSRQKKAFALLRPQEPKPPFPYKSEDVIFRNEKAGIDLAGTLTIPNGEGPFPAVVLITGSGSQNRNEELLGHKPFMVIADYFTRKGIAVLRYDDRGVGGSRGSPLNATTADFATDAEAAFLYLTSRKEVKHGAIGLAGHSEGGLIAPIVASVNRNIAFIISLAGPGVTGEEIIHTQNMDISVASGMQIGEARKNTATNRKIFAVLKKEPDNNKASEKIEAVYRKILAKEKKSAEDTEAEVKQLKSAMNPVSFTWLRYFITADPAQYWKKVKCPVLALNGGKDLQVSASVNLSAIVKAVKSGGNQSVTILQLPGLNHLFQKCTTGLPAEYGEIEETFSPEALKIMADWVVALY